MPRKRSSLPMARRVTTAILLAVAAASAAGIGWELATWPDVGALASENPRSTAFIDRYRAARRARGQDDRVRWTWVPDARIAPAVKGAVVVAEDIEFFNHRGFSTSEMKAAVRDALERGRVRGASTITQQVAKNLWLSPSKNPMRKLKEALLTRQLERHLSKRRILEIYLNVAQFGVGIYGVEAATRHYFGSDAQALTRSQAALLAASLPRPSRWHPGVESTAYTARAAQIETLMDRATFLDKYIEPPSAERAQAF